MLAKTLLSLLQPLTISLLLTTTLATPTPIAKRNTDLLTRQSTSTSASATIISYFVATACDSTFSQSTQVLSSNVCMDLGEDGTTRSVALFGLSLPSSSSSTNSSSASCTVKVWEDELCSSANNEQILMGVGSSVANKTCVDEPSWDNGSTMMGSVMLVCE